MSEKTLGILLVSLFVISIISLFYLSITGKSAMEKCEEFNSHETCVYNLR